MAQLIGELLVRTGALSAADLEEAVGWQVLYGGRLGTNLLELGVVEERALAEALGKQLGCEFVWGELDVPGSMAQMIPAVLARRHEIVPWKIEGRRLKVLTSNPIEAMPFLDELGFRIGRTIRPVVAPEYRIHQLLRRHFQSQRQMRALDFGQRVNRRAASPTSPSASSPPESLLDAGEELMDDEQFAAIYSHALQGRAGPEVDPSNAGPSTSPASADATRGHRPGPSPPPPAGFPPQAPPDPTPRHIVQPTPSASSQQGSTRGPDHLQPSPPVLVPVQPLAPIPGATADEGRAAKEEEFDGEILEGELLDEEFFEEIDDGEPDFDVDIGEEPEPEDVGPDTARQWAAAFQELEKELAAHPDTARESVQDTSPLSFSEAVEEITRADGREAVARAVLRYARSRAARAVLLNVQGNVALGWDALGDDLSPEIARRIAFSLTTPSAFRLVRESRSHYIGPLGKEPGNVRFLKLAGKKWPASAVLLPVLFRGRVVYVLYVDNGHRQHVDADVGELLILSQNITRSMEALVSRRQGAARIQSRAAQ